MKLIHPKDIYKMNWIEGDHDWSSVKIPDGIDHKYSISSENDIITERHIFTNITDKHIFTSLRDIAVYMPFNDNYTDAETCIHSRCHTHIWCGGEVSYIMCLRMGGEAPHLGLVLTEGSLGGYSIERPFEHSSDDRGDFLLHPSPAQLPPHDSIIIEWKLFWHNGKTDFFNKIKTLSRKYISVTAQHFVVFKNETVNICIEPSFKFNDNDIYITENNRQVEFTTDHNKIIICENAKTVGERVYNIQAGNIHTFCRIFVHECLDTLAYNRCKFIADKQQYQKHGDCLDGAYLIYDNKEEHIVYNSRNDLNAGRERVGMGLLIAEYLKTHNDEYLNSSLLKYIAFVKRELLDNGNISNDYNHDNLYFRLYNYPWYSLLFAELFELYKNTEYLITSYKILKCFYEKGGSKFYAIEVPLLKIMKLLKQEGMSEYFNELTVHFKNHCAYIMETGLNYPAHELSYEQSIVAPGADILLKMYELTGSDVYMDGAKIQLNALELFNCSQPDYHLFETAIRHWDGYWFGKSRLFGDTFPHYWSALTGNVYERYGRLTQNQEYLEKAEASFRSALSLIRPDGRGCCAYIYPVSVNGHECQFYDDYANDQDWGLYFMLRHINKNS